jgi:hypothetical protein
VWGDLQRPATIISFGLLIISIIAGILTSLYFYNKGTKYANITYEVEQVQVFDKNAVGILPLTVRDSSDNIIDNNIYAASVAIWNSGNAEIKGQDIREPFRLAVEGSSVKVIEIAPVFYTRNNVDAFTTDSNTGEINWKHFDSGEGFKLRVIYTNTSMADIVIKGYAIDTPIIDYDKIATQKIEQENRMNSFGRYVLILELFLIPSIFILWITWMFPAAKIVSNIRANISPRKVLFFCECDCISSGEYCYIYGTNTEIA